MVTLRIPSHLFSALRSGFNAVCDDGLVGHDMVSGVRAAFAAALDASMPGLPIILKLQSADELYALADCVEVGGKGHSAVTDDQWKAIVALIDEVVLAS
jgi:hypothetical protein